MTTKLQELRLTKRLENKILELADEYQVDLNKVESLLDQGLLFGEALGHRLEVTHYYSEYLIEVLKNGKVKKSVTLEKVRSDHARYSIIKLASHLTDLGFRAWVSTGGKFFGNSYLVYTDDSGNRTAYVQWDVIRGYQVAGTYLPSRDGGTGWTVAETAELLPKEKWSSFLYASAPSWANKSPIYTGIDEYLAKTKHSNYQPASVFLGQ